MGYLHIDNLYKSPQLLSMFKELWALEKIHGTSAHVAFAADAVRLFSGGENRAIFLGWFNHLLFGGDGVFLDGQPEDAILAELATRFRAAGFTGDPPVTVFGEAYGGRLQGMRATYGDRCRFVAFDVQVGEAWLDVPAAAEVCRKLGIEFVAYERVPATLAAVDAERDRPSRQAKRNGIVEDRVAEGVVLRPIVELAWKHGGRIIAKHKGDAFCETTTPRPVDAARVAVLADAQKIADEWVTAERLRHVVDRLAATRHATAGMLRWEPPPVGVESTGDVCRAMLEDVRREAGAEIVWSKEAERAVGTASAKAFEASLRAAIEPQPASST